MFRRSLLDVCSKRGTNAASDHHLVVDTNYFTRVKYNMEKLKDCGCIQQYVRVGHRGDDKELLGKDGKTWTATRYEEMGRRENDAGTRAGKTVFKQE